MTGKPLPHTGDDLKRLRARLMRRRAAHINEGRTALAVEVLAIIRMCDTLTAPAKAPRPQG